LKSFTSRASCPTAREKERRRRLEAMLAVETIRKGENRRGFDEPGGRREWRFIRGGL
jgi:hypothetical protein